MAPSPPILSLSLCSRCLIRRIFPPPLLRRPRSLPSSPTSSLSSYQSLLTRARRFSSSTTSGTTKQDDDASAARRARKKKLKEINLEKEKERESKVVVFEDENEELPKWTITVGLEIHAQLNTKRKLFSDARTSHVAPPNTHISPLDAALPGTQPVLNPAVLLPALRAALALNCTPAPESRFDRKHYFYWDQPAGYQITQFYAPLAVDGWLVLFEHDGVSQLEGCSGPDDGIRIGIQQIQLEQDTGKTIVCSPDSLVDLNRVGSPLIEVITHPFDCPDVLFPGLVMKKIQASLKAVNACVIGMEWGGLRADVNVSVRLTEGPEIFGQRCEIKNVSSIKAVQAAVKAEAKRQIGVLEAGGVIEGETRGWDAEKGVTRRLRGKEGEVDYRFMPDPDLPPVFVTRDLMVRVKHTLPPVPDQILAQLTSEPYGLRSKDAQTLMLWDEYRTSPTEDGVVSYYKEVVRKVQDNLLTDQYPEGLRKALREKGNNKERMLIDEKRRLVLPDGGRVAGNWMIHGLGGHLAKMNLSWKENPIDNRRMADLVSYVISKRITGPTAKRLLSTILSTTPIDPRSIPQIVTASGLETAQMPEEEILAIAKEIMSADKNSLEVLAQLRGSDGKLAAKRRKGFLSFFVGRIMKKCQGRVQAEAVEAAVVKIVSQKD